MNTGGGPPNSVNPTHINKMQNESVSFWIASPPSQSRCLSKSSFAWFCRILGFFPTMNILVKLRIGRELPMQSIVSRYLTKSKAHLNPSITSISAFLLLSESTFTRSSRGLWLCGKSSGCCDKFKDQFKFNAAMIDLIAGRGISL